MKKFLGGWYFVIPSNPPQPICVQLWVQCGGSRADRSKLSKKIRRTRGRQRNVKKQNVKNFCILLILKNDKMLKGHRLDLQGQGINPKALQGQGMVRKYVRLAYIDQVQVLLTFGHFFDILFFNILTLTLQKYKKKKKK